MIRYQRLLSQLKDGDLIENLDGCERRLVCAQAADAIESLVANKHSTQDRVKARERQLDSLMAENERLIELLADAKEAIQDLVNASMPLASRPELLKALNRAAEVLEAE